MDPLLVVYGFPADGNRKCNTGERVSDLCGKCAQATFSLWQKFDRGSKIVNNRLSL